MEHVFERIRAALPAARAEASKTGSISPLWDVIFDAEAILSNKPTLMKGSRDDVAIAMANHLAKYTNQP